jgi:hypothetical protein
LGKDLQAKIEAIEVANNFNPTRTQAKKTMQTVYPYKVVLMQQTVVESTPLKKAPMFVMKK